MIVFPNAKINLGLNITEKRNDGYHNLETVFYPVPLSDSLEVVVKPDAKVKYTLNLSGDVIEGNSDDNLVVKAYNLMSNICRIPPVEIYLCKKIPSGAGLGGGSSDAAFMLKLLNELCSAELTDNSLEELAASLGADCAFFIKNKPVYAQGIGNEFTPIDLSLQGYSLVIVKPDIFVSTKDAFSTITPCKPECSVKEIVTFPVDEWKHHLINDFEKSVFAKFPAIGRIKQDLYNMGAVYASMSGSGSSVFALFKQSQNILPEYFPGCKIFNYNL